jgi:hypothetical protein
VKRVERSDYRVEILPAGSSGERDANELADYIAEIMKRDKGLLDLVFTIRVACDSRVTCEFCGYDWETEDGTPDGEPACCSRAVEEWKADKQVKNLEAVTDRIAEEIEEAEVTTRIHAEKATIEATIRYSEQDALLTQELYRKVRGLDF